ncbi:MAG: polymer-forming cytoskeletal protein [Pseudomonadales bacterium]|nr:polymer-forming cytoskeletal protein [Pseudomonadales bacterium]
MLGKGKNKAHNIDALISANVEVTGDIHFSGGIQIDGKVRGNIEADSGAKGLLRISEHGAVNGEIHAPYVEIDGRVEGDVYAAEHLELSPNACITGNVYYSSIEMLRGAQVNGSLLHREDAATARQSKGGADTTDNGSGLAVE